MERSDRFPTPVVEEGSSDSPPPAVEGLAPVVVKAAVVTHQSLPGPGLPQ